MKYQIVFYLQYLLVFIDGKIIIKLKFLMKISEIKTEKIKELKGIFT